MVAFFHLLQQACAAIRRKPQDTGVGGHEGPALSGGEGTPLVLPGLLLSNTCNLLHLTWNSIYARI